MNDDFDVTALLPKKKKKINSRTKGNTFERKVAKILNDRFNTTDFCRSPGSGAFATTHKLPEHIQVYGDLITPKDFKFIIECKKGYNKEGICDAFNPKSGLHKMLMQAMRDGRSAGKPFMLIIGQDRKEPIVITNGSRFGYVGDYLEGDFGLGVVLIAPLKEYLASPDHLFVDTD